MRIHSLRRPSASGQPTMTSEQRPLLSMRGDGQEVRRHPGADRRLARGAAGRGACADRPERRRQVDHDQDPDRRLRQGRRRGHLRRPAVRRRLAAGGAASRDQHDLPGDQPRPLPLGDREHLPRPRASPLRPARLGPHAPRGCRGPAPLRRHGRRAPAADELQHRHPADGGDRARRLVQGQAGDHGRADQLARRARGGRPVRRHPPAQARGRGGDLRQPQARRALRRLRPGDDHARRPHGCRRARWPR